MEGRGSGGDRGRKVGAAVSSPATSSADSQQDAGDELGEQSPPADAEDKVSVTVPEEVSDARSTLAVVALHNLVRDGS